MGRKAIVWAGIAVAALALFVAGAFVSLRWLLDRGLPIREGRVEVAGLEGVVEVRWDLWGVPTVEASSDEDPARAIGYLHANDRLAQLELGRRAAAGRLSEVVGPATLELDVEMRTLRLREAAEEMVDRTGEETRRWLEAYGEGVDAWVDDHRADLPPTLRVLGVFPEPWKPADSLSFALLMARDLSFWLGRPEELRFEWLRALGAERAAELVGGSPHLPPEIVELARKPASGGETAVRRGDATDLVISALRPRVVSGALGSNNWALAPSRTATGDPVVANDPHLPLRLPSTWFEMRLRSPGYAAAGMTIPGLPGVVIGQGEHLAWALTNVMLDDHDLFFEDFDEEGLRVRRGDGWQPVSVDELEIAVKGREPVSLTLYRTDRGPLLPADPERGLPARSLVWTAPDATDPLAPFLALARATTVGDLEGALGGFVAPAQNLVAADDGGNLLWTVLGAAPSRRIGDGRFPSPGWDPDYIWYGVQAGRSRPALLDPADGMLVTANSRVAGAPTVPESFAADYDLPVRAERIRDLLETGGPWAAEEMASIQTDVVSLFAREVVARSSGDFQGGATRAYQLLADWNGAMTDRPPSALFAAFERALAEEVFGDEIDVAAVPELFRRGWLLRLLRGDLGDGWWDRADTEAAESRDEILGAALTRAWEETGGTTWGDVHRLELAHPLGGLPVVGRVFDRGPMAVDGSATTVMAFAGEWIEGQRPVVSGPSMRWVAVPGRPELALAALPGGQSGHPGDPHFDDQLDLFLRGELRGAPWLPDGGEVASGLTLRPVGSSP